MTDKSPKKLRPLVGIAANPALRGRGPKKGEGGRPPSASRAKLRQAFEKSLPVVLEIASGKGGKAVTPGDRLRAVDLLAKYGLGTQQEVDVTSGGKPVTGVIAVPVEDAPRTA